MYPKINSILSKVFVISIPLIYILVKYLDFYDTKFLFWYGFEWFLFHLSWYSLLFVMAIRPLADLQQTFLQNTKLYNLRKLVIFRKAFWILSALIIVTIFVWKYIDNPSNLQHFFNPWRWDLFYPLIARVSEFSAIILLITSNLYSQKLLKKNWKKIQRLSYVFLISGWIIAGQYENMYYYTMWILWVIYLVNIISKKK